MTSALTTDPPPETALQVAFTRQGLEALGVAPEDIEGFSDEFIAGMAGETSRSRRLGDFGANDPCGWAWGGSEDAVPHLVAMVYARPRGLGPGRRRSRRGMGCGVPGPGAPGDVRKRGRRAVRLSRRAQPAAAGLGPDAPRGDKDYAEYTNVSALGEFLLGYPNEYGRYTHRPLIDPAREARAIDLPPAEDVPTGATSAATAPTSCSGSSIRTCADSGSSWTGRRGRTRGAGALAEAMVGRTRMASPWCRWCTTGSTASGPV